MTAIVEWQDLKLVTQDTDSSCGLAVMAMIRGLTMEEIRKSLGDIDRAGPVEWREYLRHLGYKLTMHEHTDWESLWLLIVPSPNVRGATHVVVLDCRPCKDGGGAILLDPRMGNHRKFHWTLKDWLEGRVVHACAYRVEQMVPPLER